MTENIIKDFDFDFDIKDHCELSPYMVLSDSSLYHYTDNSFSSVYVQDSSHNPYIYNVLHQLENDIFSEKYYGDDKEKIEDYHNSVLNVLQNLINIDNQDPSLESQFYHPYDIIQDQIYALENFLSQLKKKLKRDFRQMPISTARFPHFQQLTTNYFFYNDDDSNQNEANQNQKDEENLTKIIENNKEETDFLISYDSLIQFHEIISKHTKAFSLSPSFVLSMISKLNSVLTSLLSKETPEKTDYNDFTFFTRFRNLPSDIYSEEEKAIRIKYFKLINLIKIRLYIILQKMHESLVILLQFILMEQDNFNNETDNTFSFKNFFQDSLPDTKRRSKIIEKYSSDQILDFCFSPSGDNDFFLTKEGVFQINELNSIQKIEFKEEEKEKMHEILQKSDKTTAKLSFSNGILYLLFKEDKTIHKILISNDQIVTQKENEKENNSERELKEEEESTKLKGKKQREKEKKEKKMKRKEERKNKEKFEKNLERVKINIPDYPIVSVGFYNDYFRILQRKSYENRKTTYLFTNVDLTPNCRMNYDVFEAFEKNEKENQISETTFEFEIEDKDEKCKINDAFFSGDLIFFTFDDSSVEQLMIYKSGTIEKFKHSISPFLIHSYSRVKMDNDSFLYVLEPVEKQGKESVCINKMYLPETKHYIRAESEIFLNYPYLQKLSDIVDNCSQFIINKEVSREITSDEYIRIQKKDNGEEEDKNEKKKKNSINNTNSFSFEISPEEMSCIIQSPSSIAEQFEFIKKLINGLKDENLKNFFVCLLIKICAINLLYGTSSYYTSKDKMTESTINRFKKFKTFYFDLISSVKQSSNANYEIMLKESILFLLTLAGKFLFLPDQYEMMNERMKDLFYVNNESKLILRSLSSFIFSYPSSLYFIDDSFYNQLLEFKEQIDIQKLFMKNIQLIVLEKRFTEKIMDDEFIQYIFPYIQSLFKYIHYLLSNESIPLIETEELFSYLFGMKIENPFMALMIEKELVQIAPILYDRIKKTPGVVESDQEYRRRNKDIEQQIVHKEIKIIESQHPYNLKVPEEEEEEEPKKHKNKSKSRRRRRRDQIVEDIGVIDFGLKSDVIYCIFDNRCEISPNDSLVLKSPNDRHGSKTYSSRSDFSFNQAINFEDNKVSIRMMRDKELQDPCWGYKMTFIGVSFDNTFYWYPNLHLNFYNHFIAFLTNIYEVAFCSTKVTKNEKEFNIILNNKIIQGIKFEEIDNYEKENDQENTNKPLKRKLTRGISRGISYDSDNDSAFDDNFKKSFLKDLLTVTEDSQTRGKQLLDLLYSKTAKQNRIKLTQSTKSILENEHYLAACLFKQLGLINLCLKFINNEILTINNNDNDNKYENIEVPSALQSIWKKIYNLRKVLFFAYQKSKYKTDSTSIKLNFIKYSEEIKRKCKLLLYSDPILKFKEKGNLDNDTLEGASKSIFSFVTSEIPLSDISELIDIRRKRLSITSQSLSHMKSFFEKNLFFDSSKFLFVKYSDFYKNFKKFDGVTEKELEDLNKLYGSLSLLVVKTIFDDPSIAIILNHNFLKQCLFDHTDNDSKLECSKVFINILEKNKNNDNFAHDYTNFVMISAILAFAAKTKDDQLVDYIVSNLLVSDQIDLQSKRLILTVIPSFVGLMPDNKKVVDKELAFSILSKSFDLPVIARTIFYWLSLIINSQNDESAFDFIMKVFKGIGRSFTGQSCLFINESFQPFAHRSVAEGMISFIRLLINNKNEALLKVIHEILTNKITQNDTYRDELIGLFASIGQTLSAMEPERKVAINERLNLVATIIGLNTSKKRLRSYDQYGKKIIGAYINNVLFDPNKLDLTEQEITNLLDLHDKICKLNEQNYEVEINQTEISENLLIATFYSFLPVIMQNKNNVKILMNDENLKRSLSFFEFSMNSLPSNENSILFLSHHLEQAITSPLYKSNEIFGIDKSNNFRFMKMNFGEVTYNDGNDLIKTVPDHKNVFICCRPFDSDLETYFELKINKIGSRQIFIGFVDSNRSKIDKAFGFGSVGHSKVFCRRCHYLARRLEFVGDQIMKKEKNPILLEKDDRIGCYYTSEYTYLTINGKMSKYRLSNSSLDSYVPIIIIDHDDVELEVTQNVTIVDQQFPFLKVDDPKYFNEKDIQKLNDNDDRIGTDGEFKEKNHLIGQQIYICKTISSQKKSKLETIDVFPHDLLRYRENYGIIKDINTFNDSRFVTKLKVESYDNYTLSKDIINYDIDSRYVKGVKTNFFNLIENRTNRKLGINSSFDMKYLPEKLRKGSDFNSISRYLRSKTIKDNSRSIAIIMTRYLTFVLLDYLRLSKSILLQDEGIESEETKKIIQALTVSLPTITTFRPKFIYTIDKDKLDLYNIFIDENEENEEERKERDTRYFYILPGFSKMFNFSFKLFLQQSEKSISPDFISKLLESSIEKSMNECLNSSSLYDMIPSDEKIESPRPLPKRLAISKELNDSKLKARRIVGYIPILLSSIPEILPSAKCTKRRLRNSSDENTYFNFLVFDNVKMKWKYDIKELREMKMNQNKNLDLKLYKDYKLKLGVLLLSKDLPENLLNGSLGFIQIIFNIFQAFNDSEFLFDKLRDFMSHEFLEKFFSLAMKKNPLVCPFLQVIIVNLISKYGFQDTLFYNNANKASFIFGQTSNNLFKMDDFPSGQNELPLLFSLISNLSQTRISELLTNNENIGDLFDKYDNINNEIMKVTDNEISKKEQKFTECEIHKEAFSWRSRRRRRGRRRRNYHGNDDDSENKKKKNYRSFYLAYYYSCLLHIDEKIPYPMFLFVHVWLMQQFGAFRMKVNKMDIKQFKKIEIEDNKEIIYKSEIFKNETDLNCSLQKLNIYESNEEECSDDDDDDIDELILRSDSDNSENEETNDNDNDQKIKKKKIDKMEDYYVAVHQLTDNKNIKIPKNGQGVNVSFPLEVIVIHEKGNKNRKAELKTGDFYLVDFRPSESQQKECFIKNYDQIQTDVQQFNSLAKYDNELFDSLSHINTASANNKNSNNTSNDNNNTSNDNNNTSNDNNNNSNDNNNNSNDNNNNSNDNNNNSNDNNNNSNDNNNNSNDNNNNSNDNNNNSNDNNNNSNDNNNNSNDNNNNSNDNNNNSNDNNNNSNDNNNNSNDNNNNSNDNNNNSNDNNNKSNDNNNNSNDNNNKSNDNNNKSNDNNNNSNDNNNTSNDNNNTSNDDNNTSNDDNNTSNDDNNTSNDDNNTSNDDNNTSNDDNNTSNDDNNTSNDNNNTSNDDNNTSNDDNNTSNDDNNTSNDDNNTSNDDNNTSNDNNNTSNDDNNTSNDDNNTSNDDNNTSNDDNTINIDDDDNDEYSMYEIKKIDMNPSVVIDDIPDSISPRVVSLRCSVISMYNRIIEGMMVSYTLAEEDDDSNAESNWWRNTSSSDEKPSSQYMKQVIGPAYSMSTRSKFAFINNILKNEKKGNCELSLIFNRFEAEKFHNKFTKEGGKDEDKSGVFARPLFVQFMEQVDDDSIQLLKVRGAPPFSVNLVGEGAIDGGGPAREIFSSLIIEMMSEHIGMFTYNPNRRHKNKETNQEDLIPNPSSNETELRSEFSNDVERLLSKGLTFCGALIAACIVSALPQPMKLASMVWEYLTSGYLSIESIYEIDSNFYHLIQDAESLEKVDLSNLTDEQFNREFNHVFEIHDSFGKTIELVPSGSKVPVTKENLHDFIQLAKKWRLHEFDDELKDIKEGFEKIMTYKNITSILHPDELKLLVCGEPNCSIEHMKNLIDISVPYDDTLSEDDIKTMFWNVLESFTPDERMKFIRFSTGNLGLPAPGLKWDENMSVEICSREDREKNGKNMIHSSTCSSSVSIPFFEKEDELERMLRMALSFSGIITDNTEHFEEISADFF